MPYVTDAGRVHEWMKNASSQKFKVQKLKFYSSSFQIVLNLDNKKDL